MNNLSIYVLKVKSRDMGDAMGKLNYFGACLNDVIDCGDFKDIEFSIDDRDIESYEAWLSAHINSQFTISKRY